MLTDLSTANVTDSVNSRKSVLRQQSYKLAQQQPVLPPLPGGQAAATAAQLAGLDPSVFRPITDDESRLHAHQEEDEPEEGDEDDVCIDGGGSGCQTARHSPWPQLQPGEIAWQTLPVTMGECKLTDSNSSLSRLSPLLQMSQFQSLQSTSPIPFRWEPQPSSSLHLPQPSSSMLPHQERMDTSGP